MDNLVILSKSQLDHLIEKIDQLLANKESPPDQEKEWLNTKEATDFLGIGQTTLWTYRKQGKIKGRKIGHKLYFSSSELNKLLANS